ncbi:MAG: ATP phosphoribosyltransferase [Rhodobacteraceae bacterium]|nr:ATP phosphoribosyltransferase [Paracoccaceae bacterium]
MTKLTIAIPSKGRLQENTDAFFGRAGLKVQRPGGARNYRGKIRELDNVEIAFLSASEIARELAAGNVHFGITGLDLVHENIAAPEKSVHIVTPLGFGHADVVTAVPKAWIDVETMTDLGDVASDFRNRHGRRMRVATKYVALTRSFFASYGIADYRIVESAGATEGAPAADAAELIVDITSTGSTLTANNLKILSDGVMLRSQAHLVSSLNAEWSDNAQRAARSILDRVDAEEQARSARIVKAQIDPASVSSAQIDDLGYPQPYGPAHNGVVSLLCPKAEAADCARKLIDLGAETVTVETLEYVFTRENTLFAAMLEKIKA